MIRPAVFLSGSRLKEADVSATKAVRRFWRCVSDLGIQEHCTSLVRRTYQSRSIPRTSPTSTPPLQRFISKLGVPSQTRPKASRLDPRRPPSKLKPFRMMGKRERPRTHSPSVRLDFRRPIVALWEEAGKSQRVGAAGNWCAKIQETGYLLRGDRARLMHLQMADRCPEAEVPVAWCRLAPKPFVCSGSCARSWHLFEAA